MNIAFGRLLKGAINSIAAYEGKTAPAVEADLGAQIGVSGSAIQRYKTGYVPPEPRTVEILAEAAVRRGYLGRAWLERFLEAAGYLSPDALITRLTTASTPAPLAAGEHAALPSGTLIFLFTDIVSSTSLWEQQPQLMERALARHDTLMRQAIITHNGQVFKTVGDAFYALFTTGPDALDAALSAQRAFAVESRHGELPLQVRMALHTGAAQLRDGDYFGPPLNRVARLLAAGHGGQILLSLPTEELVRDHLPEGIDLRDLGEHRLKDLARPERIFQVIASDLPSEFPPLQTLDRYKHNLPPQLTPLIGREAEVRAVCDLLNRGEVRLLTLVGPGGVGKTRLALQAAVEVLDTFRDGVCFVPFAPISDPELVAATIAQALNITTVGDRPLVEQLKAALRTRQQLFLLDNFEQVAGAAPLITEILAAAPDVKVLVTSRVALHLRGEYEYTVPPLRLPDTQHLPALERLTQYEAVQLFIERAKAVRPTFAVTDANAPAIAEICVRLDGLPLAIELAAARIKTFAPQALLPRLEKRLTLLTGGPWDLPVHQRTLRGTIAWSYDLLSVEEQILFTRLSIFAGGCTLAAAELVLSDEGRDEEEDLLLAIFIAPDTVLNGLSALVDKSLLQQLEGLDGEPRFTMLETIREYALERLTASSELRAMQQRHARYYLGLAETTDLYGSQLTSRLQQLDAEHDNFRAALGAVYAAGDAETMLRISGALGRFWDLRGRVSEGRGWLAKALHLSANSRTPARAWVFKAAANLAQTQADYQQAIALHEEGLAIQRAIGQPIAIAAALNDLALAVVALGDYDRAAVLHQESLALARAHDVTFGTSAALANLGCVFYAQGDIQRARVHIEEALTLARRVDNTYAIARGLNCLGNVTYAQGERERARALHQEGLALCQQIADIGSQAIALINLAQIELSEGTSHRAATTTRKHLCSHTSWATGARLHTVWPALRSWPNASSRRSVPRVWREWHRR
jgi:predicted ATPase/class 3 adenylate cyclase